MGALNASFDERFFDVLGLNPQLELFQFIRERP
jgi:hypothetical protein